MLVCFALAQEAAPFRRQSVLLPNAKTLVVGIGPRNAARAIAQACEPPRPGLVLTCGFCGGLDPALKWGDIVCETNDEALQMLLADAGGKIGRFHCAERIAVTAAEKQALAQSTGAQAVEMESGPIQAHCRQVGVRCATVRVVSDTAQEDLPLDFNVLFNAQMRPSPIALARELCRRPSVVPKLIRLNGANNQCAVRLADFLMRILRPA